MRSSAFFALRLLSVFSFGKTCRKLGLRCRSANRHTQDACPSSNPKDCDQGRRGLEGFSRRYRTGSLHPCVCFRDFPAGNPTANLGLQIASGNLQGPPSAAVAHILCACPHPARRVLGRFKSPLYALKKADNLAVICIFCPVVPFGKSLLGIHLSEPWVCKSLRDLLTQKRT